MPSFIWGTT
ncbi:uncharacterized protein FTOL_13988 [Fusarium torulosum]|uniref:Uncharacterized protein n=1 Tax=Fusarium torulosum TaxID=33205 RepID=A0AAE8MMY8_9HYPO|nr:uncharacterized protein FTOL_13988 [Fusarium torulosum]